MGVYIYCVYLYTCHGINHYCLAKVSTYIFLCYIRKRIASKFHYNYHGVATRKRNEEERQRVCKKERKNFFFRGKKCIINFFRISLAGTFGNIVLMINMKSMPGSPSLSLLHTHSLTHTHTQHIQ